MPPLRIALPASVLLLCGLAAQTPPSLRIAVPAEGTYVSGPVKLTATVDPPSSVPEIAQIVFFADGRQVCTISRPPFECQWHAGATVAEHMFRAVATLRDGRRLVQTVRTRGVIVSEAVDVDVIQVTAVVTDGSGRFVRGLTQSDFKVFDDGKPQPISNFVSEQIPLEMVAAIDVSSSMRAAIGTVKETAKRFLAGLDPADQVTVLSFNENIFTLATRATDASARTRAVDLMEAWGGTALYDAIVKAVDILGRQSGRRAVVLFSDGDDQSSHAALETAIRATEGSDATIYAIGQGRAVDTPALQALLRQIADVSGGRAFFSDDLSRLDGVFAEILEDLRNQYLISYPAPENRRNGEWHTIKVEAGGGRYQVRARQGYRLARDRRADH
jgi:VWFA-related protein